MRDCADLKLQCTAVVRELMLHNDWQLLPEDVFAEAVLERFSPQQTATREQLRTWSINTYCWKALYPACLGLHGQSKRRRGFEELATYLYRIAHKRWSHVAEDATQEALLMIYEKVEDCRNPGAFLAFAIQQLRDAARKFMRAEAREVSLDAWLEEDFYGDIPADAGIGVGRQVEGEEAALYSDQKRRVADRVQTVRQQNPRAHRQLDAVQLRYFRGLSNEETAIVLDTTPENVSVLVHRGLQKLREDELLLEMAEDILQGSVS